MSQLLIDRYLNELSDLRRASGSHRETIVREAFKGLLKSWGRTQDLIFIPEYLYQTNSRDRRYVDGALVYDIRVPFGYWEAKDAKDNLDDEIDYKLRRGYPQDNIIFEDSREAVLIQNKQLVSRCRVDEVEKLEKLLGLFFEYERPEITQFRKAVEQFKADLPAVLLALRKMIESALRSNRQFADAAANFLTHAKTTINPNVSDADVREMLIQHILTEEIFSKVFGQDDFHRQNNVAKELYALEATFFRGGLKWKTLKNLDSYYAAIRSAAAQIWGHHEKQTFLKVIYENFYKVYNKKLADRLGVVYTPNEIVRFIVDNANQLCSQHFGKKLIDRNVEILEPAAGTGTFVTELIDFFRGQPAKLKQKYAEELHANEVAILPYYVANLNIEASYATITGEYEEFQNLCFVDTLDSVEGLRTFPGKQEEMFGALSQENYQRIKRQNKRRISVVIGNPPYNANQQNENENNKNRKYPTIDRRIKQTYIAASTAQKTKLYDMYVRFFRWASDRIEENGIVAFITNRSFLDARNFDGFRKVVASEFAEIHILDLGGDWKKKGAAGGGNVFGIGTGVAISFWVKKKTDKPAKIFYGTCSEGSGEDKRVWLSNQTLEMIPFREIFPQPNGDWLDKPKTSFGSAIAVASKEVKQAKDETGRGAIFKLFSLGVVTNRDDWVYDHDEKQLAKKVSYLIDYFNRTALEIRKKKIKKPEVAAPYFEKGIKWTRAVKRDALKGRRYSFSKSKITECLFRPFAIKALYFDKDLNEMRYQLPSIFPPGITNKAILISSGRRGGFNCLATRILPSLDVFLPNACQVLPFARVDKSGTWVENISDWAVAEFQAEYGKDASREAIFDYVYAVLNDPIYRKKYATNLAQEFPHIPFYKDFSRWSAWGKALFSLHADFRQLKPWPLNRIDKPDKIAGHASLKPKAVLRASKDAGVIVVDSETQLTNIPAAIWAFQIGSRSAVEWVLDQYRERSLRDTILPVKYTEYEFSEFKEQVIDLLKRVTRASVETVQIVEAMRDTKR